MVKLKTQFKKFATFEKKIFRKWKTWITNLESKRRATIVEQTTDRISSRIDMTELSESLAKVKSEIAKVIVGQESMIEHLLVVLFSKRTRDYRRCSGLLKPSPQNY